MTDLANLQALDEQAWTFLCGMVADLNDEQIARHAPAIDERSIAGVTIHAYVSAFYMVFPLAGKDWPTMSAEPPATTADLLSTLDDMHARVKELLADLPAGALEKMYDMPWGVQWQGRQAMVSALAHALVHAGAIQGMRAMLGFPTPPEKS